VPCITRQEKSGYVVRFYPAWDSFPTDNIEADTRRMNAFLEDRIREMPEQYFWVHKRFKTRPQGEASLYG
jgi:KDO2-lipid IV(A) lauroyltransferase